MSYEKQAQYYDVIYASMGKDYQQEADDIRQLISANKQCEGHKLLDLACGTGLHLKYLKDHFDVQGIDLEPKMLEIAHARLPEITFRLGNMLDFEVPETFDVITCLFSSIGYMRNVNELNQALKQMTTHLNTGGVIVIEAWLHPEMWGEGHVGAVFVDQPQLKISRINDSQREGNISIMNMNYTIGTPDGVVQFTEIHKMTLFTDQEYRYAFSGAGLHVNKDEGFRGRSIYVGVKS